VAVILEILLGVAQKVSEEKKESEKMMKSVEE
jgi:hypothetical protein